MAKSKAKPKLASAVVGDEAPDPNIKSVPGKSESSKDAPRTDEPRAESNKTSDVIDVVKSGLKFIYLLTWTLAVMQAAVIILKEAYNIRLYAINEYGRIIHEFDPYFNYRATEYLYEHGWHKFAHWFDYKVWYPLGRPVGTTIYPGMQVTAVFLKNAFDFAVEHFNSLVWWVLAAKDSMSLNDICCFIPSWFGSIATLMTGLMAYEASLGVAGTDAKMSTQVEGAPQEFGSIINTVPVIGFLYRSVLVRLGDMFVKSIRLVFGSDLNLDTRRHTTPALSSPAIEAALCSMGVMSVVPAHIMRSVGGGYDNESVAMTAMTLTFWLWMRSLRGGTDTDGALKWGVATGMAYFYMVAVWGGYVFVLNLVGCHAAVLVLLGRYSTKLHRSYTTFYLVGTALATTVPVVGWTPLKSLEQVGPMAVFVGMQLIEFCEVQRRKKKLDFKGAWALRIRVFGLAAVAAACVIAALWPTGYFGPISARVRGLFVKHTKTGNPLVDSVAEHQAAKPEAYFQYLNDAVYIAPVGFILVSLFYFHDSSSFLLVYAAAAYFFSHKMVRLILLTSPIASALGGVALGRAFGWCLTSLADYRPSFGQLLETLGNADEDAGATEVVEAQIVEQGAKGGKKKPKQPARKSSSGDKEEGGESPEEASSHLSAAASGFRNIVIRVVRVILSVYFIRDIVIPHATDFHNLSHQMAQQMSHPTIVYKANTRSGQTIIVDDYREAYLWLKDNTPEDARIMAWWDYGYQITAIGNRTTIADGNTWNHEHIALLGRTLTSPEKDAHRIARHLADYVLVWAGGGGDDLAKSPHLRRIGNSIYRHMCPGDPTCRSFGFINGQPSESMAASLLYKLHSNGLQPGAEVDRNRFKDVFQSKHGKVRIYKILSVSKESKDWVVKNRECDAPGSWYCPGQYPPAVQKIVNEGRNFAQLEDFNRGESDEEYQKKYFEMLNNPDKADRKAASKEKARAKKTQLKEIEDMMKSPEIQAQIKEMNSKEYWMDTEITSRLWEVVNENDAAGLKEVMEMDPMALHARSKDGRGPMFWAYESGSEKMIKFLRRFGVSETFRDSSGKTPADLG